ncbi:MAG: aminoacyl-histidine dipeptidase [Clostridiales bacterium]|nr:aminoacyl-histidine dipeptidase [Clostridiales bacterium]
MAVLFHLEPASVFHYFEEICSIPHGSGNTRAISDYCVRFAQAHGLRCVQDTRNNVIIYQPGTPGYEQSPAVMLQGHLDMVCEKEPDCNIDFTADGLRLQVEDGVISAQGTTLGGDDGIAVAYALAILAAEDIPHPPLEVVLTVDEEIGLLGAAALDGSLLQSRILLNIDSEEEGHLLISCAGGATATCRLPVERGAVSGQLATLTVEGLRGGHSGTEIIQNRANANVLLGRALYALDRELDYDLLRVDGGAKDNAIPRQSVAQLVVNPEERDLLADFAAEWSATFAKEYQATDPGVSLRLELGDEGDFLAMSESDKCTVVSSLVLLPNGIQRMSGDIPGLVQTSLNLGILRTVEDEVSASFSVRSSMGSEKTALLHKLTALMGVLGGRLEVSGEYPAWEYRPDSPLRDLMVQVFEEQYGHPPVVEAIHAGVECGLLSDKLPGLDCVSFGPDMKDVHTTAERMDAASVQRVWNYLLEVLKRLK